jgi:hypothetical protein
VVVLLGVPAIPKAQIAVKLGKTALETIRNAKILKVPMTSQPYSSYFKESSKLLVLL